jgi:hypothetical protein
MNFEGPKAQVETAKQIITLSTGAIAFTVTFLDKLRPHAEGKALPTPISLYVSWILFGLTVGLALWHLMALNGNITAMARKENGWPLTPADELSANGDEGNARLPGILMLLSFLASVVSLVWAGISMN